METLNAASKYLVLVDMDEVNSDSVADKLIDAGIKEVVVLGIPQVPGIIQFYEILNTAEK
jgi:hypothetical protein